MDSARDTSPASYVHALPYTSAPKTCAAHLLLFDVINLEHRSTNTTNTFESYAYPLASVVLRLRRDAVLQKRKIAQNDVKEQE